jgi:hypothetical protein
MFIVAAIRITNLILQLAILSPVMQQCVIIQKLQLLVNSAVGASNLAYHYNIPLELCYIKIRAFGSLYSSVPKSYTGSLTSYLRNRHSIYKMA